MLADALPNRAMPGLTAPRRVQKTRNWLKLVPNSMSFKATLATVGM